MAKIKKRKKAFDKQHIVIAKSDNKTRVTVAVSGAKRVNTVGVISVPKYREIAQSELLVDEVIIKNLVQRRTSKALWEKIVKELRKSRFLDGKEQATNSIIAKSLG